MVGCGMSEILANTQYIQPFCLSQSIPRYARNGLRAGNGRSRQGDQAMCGRSNVRQELVYKYINIA